MTRPAGGLRSAASALPLPSSTVRTRRPAPGDDAAEPTGSGRRSGKVRVVHCSLHKCLTVFYGRVMRALFDLCLPWSGGYRHFNSHLEEFYAGFASHRVASVNNRALDLARLGRFRLSRFVRDPRDLVVSGFFYHRRGAEPWTRIVVPTREDWTFANGCVPEGLRASGSSFAQYLQSVPKEEGLLAELEFRTCHFESMDAWPIGHPDILTCRYEDIIGREAAVMHRLFEHYGFSPVERWLGLFFARRYSLRRRTADPHVRDPACGQWRQHFTPRVKDAFDARWAALIEHLGYPAS